MADNDWRYKKYKPIYDKFIKLYPFTLEDLPGEMWKWIPNYEDRYQCSNFGRVKSLNKGEVTIRKPCLLNDGYLVVGLCKGYKTKTFKIARLVAELFPANPFNKPQVNHLHGRWNNYYGCLEWATSSENIQHAYDTGLHPSGEGHYNAKLTNTQVEHIRENPDNLNTYRLAEIFGVGETIVSAIQRGKARKNAGGQIRETIRPRLSEKQREEIRTLKRTGEYSQRQLAKMFGVNRKTIWRILNGK